jgi:hypothetical protein
VPDPCDTVPQAATFESIACRLEVLDVTMAQLGSVTPNAPKLRDRVAQADDLALQAETACAAGDQRGARKYLKKAFGKLKRLRKLLASKTSRSIPQREVLIAVVDDLRDDLRSLRAAVVCPSDAATSG